MHDGGSYPNTYPADIGSSASKQKKCNVHKVSRSLSVNLNEILFVGYNMQSGGAYILFKGMQSSMKFDMTHEEFTKLQQEWFDRS